WRVAKGSACSLQGPADQIPCEPRLPTYKVPSAARSTPSGKKPSASKRTLSTAQPGGWAGSSLEGQPTRERARKASEETERIETPCWVPTTCDRPPQVTTWKKRDTLSS